MYMQNRAFYYNFLLIISILFFFFGAVYFHEPIAQAVLNAGTRCIFVILPSLYLFSILAAFCVRSGFLELLAEPFQKIIKTDAVLWLVVIFSQIGGYPAGAQLLHNLYQNGRISQEQERNLLCACMGCGFGFLFATVGGNLRTALALWLIISLPNFILAGCLIRNHNIKKAESPEKLSFSVLLTESVDSAASAMLKICGMILAFGAFMGILYGIFGDFNQIFASILEISNLSDYMKNGGTLPVAAGLLSFGGCCVHFQIAAVCENHLDWMKFLVCRILTAVSSGLLCRICLKFFFPESVPAFLINTVTPAYSTQNAVPACCLAVMSVFVLKKYDFFHKSLTNCKK